MSAPPAPTQVGGTQIREVLTRLGQLYQEDLPNPVLCKPKLMPLKSVTLEKLEKMQKDAQDTVKQQELESKQELDVFGLPQN